MFRVEFRGLRLVYFRVVFSCFRVGLRVQS